MAQTSGEILDAERLEPIDRPQATLTHLKEGEPLRYTATVVVRPDVSLGDYTAHGATVEAGPPTGAGAGKNHLPNQHRHRPPPPRRRRGTARDNLQAGRHGGAP